MEQRALGRAADRIFSEGIARGKPELPGYGAIRGSGREFGSHSSPPLGAMFGDLKQFFTPHIATSGGDVLVDVWENLSSAKFYRCEVRIEDVHEEYENAVEL